MNEGKPTTEFAIGRRLHQGDPLSPALFNLVLKMLSKKYHHAKKMGDLDVFLMGGLKSLSHLIFVDDLLVITRANHKSLTKISRIRHSFSD